MSEGARARGAAAAVPASAWIAAAVIFALCLGATLWLHRELLSDEQANLEAGLTDELSSARQRLVTHLDERARALRRVANRFAADPPLERHWRADVAALEADLGGLTAVQWVDEVGVARWVEPVRGNENAVGYDLNREPRRRTALESARASGDLVCSAPVELVQGGRGFLVAAPILGEDAAFRGFIVGVLRVEQTFTAVTRESEGEFGYRVIHDREVLYESGLAGVDEDFAPRRASILWRGLSIELEVIPTRDWVSARRSELPETVLAAGITIAVLAAMSMFLRQLELRRARALSETTALQDALFASASHALIALDQEGRIRSFNPAAERLSGRRAEEVLGQVSLPSLLAPPQGRGADPFGPDALDQVLGRAVEGNVEEREWDLVRPDGSLVPIELTVGRIQDVAGAPQRFIAIAQDVTERRRGALALRSAKEVAEQALEAKSAFLARMSHEIRTPLNGVLGMLELALRTPLSSEQREYLETSRQSARALLGILNDVLDLSKLGVRKLRLERRPFALRDGLGEVLRTLASRAHERGLDLMFGVEPEVPDALVGDLARLRQVLINLVGNALKFTEQGEIAVRVALHQALDGAVILQFTVADTGAGIPADRQAAIFEAFTQGADSTSRTHGGTGLGLAISAELVALMGGRIWVESDEGKGSRFHFLVRFELGEEQTSAPRVEELSAAAVVVVEDSAQQREILAQLLRGWRMRPLVAATAEAAQAAILEGSSETEVVRLILCDAELPEGGAAQVAASLREHPMLWRTRVIWLTARGSLPPELEVPGRSLRCSKPVVPSPLLEAIERALSGAEEEQGAVAAPEPARSARPVRVLVADDNPVNRTVVTRLLEKAGHQVVGVEDGAQAVKAVQSAAFDLVLMDVQMPVMDGLEATRAIRSWEASLGRRTAIVALTAQVMREDVDRCLAAGMDAYLPKPIEPELLFATVEGRAAPAAAEGPKGEPVDLERLRTLTGNSPALLTEVVGIFLEDLPEMLREVEAALGEATRLTHAAHRLKGSLLNVACDPAAEAAKALEWMGRQGELAGAQGRYRELREAVGAAEAVLRALLTGR